MGTDGRSQLTGRARTDSLRYSWMSCTAIDPVPTADATRLMEPWRTSPAANTPGVLVVDARDQLVAE